MRNSKFRTVYLIVSEKQYVYIDRTIGIYPLPLLIILRPAGPSHPSFDILAYNGIDAGKTLCLVDALHGFYYACGYENAEVILPPAYLSEEDVLALQKEGYALRACGKLPLNEKTDYAIGDPVTGLENAAWALANKGAFG